MNLYEIRFRHYSQKDSQEGILCYLAVESDEDVYEWIKSEPENIYVNWDYKDNPEDVDEFEKGFKERIIKCRGDMYDDNSYVSDLYYGAIEYGWELLKRDIDLYDILKLKGFGINVYY